MTPIAPRFPGTGERARADAGRPDAVVGHRRRQRGPHAARVRRAQAAGRAREPALHAQFAAVDDEGLAGFCWRGCWSASSVLSGRRCASNSSACANRCADAASATACSPRSPPGGARHGAAEVQTAADWRSTAMLGWFRRPGFELAPHHVIDCAVDGGPMPAEPDRPVALEPGRRPGARDRLWPQRRERPRAPGARPRRRAHDVGV
jgi:hypothetical protein